MAIHVSCHCPDCRAAALIAQLIAKHGISKKEYEELRKLSSALRESTHKKLETILELLVKNITVRGG